MRLESALSEKVVDRLRELETENHGEGYKPKFTAGDKAIVEDGPFAGQSATVLDRNVGYGLVCVEIEAFGGAIPATMEESQLEAV